MEKGIRNIHVRTYISLGAYMFTYFHAYERASNHVSRGSLRGYDSASAAVPAEFHVHQQHVTCVKIHQRQLFYFLAITLPQPTWGEWADPGGSAIPGQPVAEVKQASSTPPNYKNKFNILGPNRTRIRY